MHKTLASPYRILMLAPTSFFADYGCHVRILEEARILQKLGHSVTIATYHNGGPAGALEIRRTLPIPWRKHYEVGSSRHKVVFDALLGLKTVELLATRRFDVIHAHLHEGALIGLVLGRLFRTPVVFDFQGSMTAEMLDHHFLKATSRFYQPLLRLERWIDQTAQHILTSSNHARATLLDTFCCSDERVHVLADAVNADVFVPRDAYDANDLAALRSRLGIPPGRRLVVYLGLLAEHQGVGLLLDAMQQVVQAQPQSHLLLMGFPNLEQYRDQAARLGISDYVTFTGRVPYDQAPAHLALGDVAAAPKLSLTEGAGKLLNYMSVGLPVVAFDTPVAREYLGSHGILAPRGDVHALAAALLSSLWPSPEGDVANRVRAQQLRQRAMQQFSWEKAGAEIVRIYDLLCDRTHAEAGAPEWPIPGR